MSCFQPTFREASLTQSARLVRLSTSFLALKAIREVLFVSLRRFLRVANMGATESSTRNIEYSIFTCEAANRVASIADSAFDESEHQ